MSFKMQRTPGKKQKSMDGGVMRIPKTFVFDQNLPKEDYLKYISPENIIPESVEIASQVFASYRKRTGSQNMNRLNKTEAYKFERNKSSILPFESPKGSPSKSNKADDDGVSRNKTIEEVFEGSMRKGFEKNRLNESTNDFKGYTANFSISQDSKIQDFADRPHTTPNKKLGFGKSMEESPNHLKLIGASSQMQNNPNAMFNKAATQENFFKSNGERVEVPRSSPVKSLLPKKKKITEKDYKITELDSTQDIVRKTDLAVRTLLKKGEQVKRDVRNFEEAIKSKLKENHRVPIESIRAVSLVKDFVFNEEEFEKLLEEDDEQDKVHRRTFSDFNNFKEKNKLATLKHVESKVKHLQNLSASKFVFSPMKKSSTFGSSITITETEKRKVAKEVQEQLTQKAEELQKQLEHQTKAHEDLKIFSNERNVFRIQSLNYTKLVKEKEKIKNKLMRDLKTSKYKEREALTATIQSHRIRSVQSDRASLFGLGTPKNPTKTLGDSSTKEEAKGTSLFKIREVLTKPIKDNDGSKLSDFKTHITRLEDLRKKYSFSIVERVNTASFQHL